MFGHDSEPCRIWSFGAKEPLDPKPVEQQMYLGHKYRNTLVEIELRRRAMTDAILAEFSPRLYQLEQTEIPAAEAAAEDAFTKLKAEQSRVRKKVRPESLVEPVKIAKQRLADLRKERKELRAALFGSPEWESVQTEFRAACTTARKEAYAAAVAGGLYWSTVLFIDQSMSDIGRGAPPKFHRWSGAGHIAVQIQNGISPEDLFSGSDTRVRVNAPPPEAWDQGGRKLRRTKALFRIGSDAKKKPIWATMPIMLHRQLPVDCQIKWVHIIRRKIGPHFKWLFQLSLTRKDGWLAEDRSLMGTVGIDVGWRMKADGSLRVASWYANEDEHGELTLSAGWLKEMRKVEDIRSIRDTNFDTVRPAVHGLLSALPKLPEWIEDTHRTLMLWKSTARFSAVVVKWRSNRFEGDQIAFNLAEEWRKRDKHLLCYEAHLRDQLKKNRSNTYREFAVEMRRKYREIKIEDFRLSAMQTTPKADEPAKDRALTEHKNDACISDLRKCLVETGNVVKVLACYTTMDCFACGSREQWDHAELTHTCSKCGQVYDQDRNAAINILRSEPEAEKQSTEKQ